MTSATVPSSSDVQHGMVNEMLNGLLVAFAASVAGGIGCRVLIGMVLR